jgi:hypothetical protein
VIKERNAIARFGTALTTRFTYDFTGNLIQEMDAGSSLNLKQTFVLDDLTKVAFVSRSEAINIQCSRGARLTITSR